MAKKPLNDLRKKERNRRLLSIQYLRQLAYCPRIFYWREVAGLKPPQGKIYNKPEK